MLEVGFTCNKCFYTGTVKVAARRFEQNVVEWLKNVVTPAVDQEHTKRSLLCDCKTVDLKIPIPDKNDPNAWIGKEVKS